MHAVCSICGDVFTGIHPEVIHATLCGHLFHYVCLHQWLQRSKTCPQCRSPVNDRKTVKLFFQISTYHSTQDSGTLENEVQNLKFKITLQDIDIKKLTEEKDLVKNQASGLRTKLLKREEQIRNHETVVSSLHDQIKILKFEMKSLTEVQLRAEELQQKLEQYQSVDIILKASASDTAEHLALIKDRTDTGILCDCINVIKKEIEHYKKVEKDLRGHLRLTETKLSSALSEIDKLREQNSMINRCFIKVKEDLSNAEKEIESLKKKCKHLEESINDGSSSSNPRDKALRRFINEYPTPQIKNMTPDAPNVITVDIHEEGNISPTSPDRLCNLNKLRHKSILTKRRLIPSSSNLSMQCYDGFGGHVKEEPSLTGKAELINAINRNKNIKSSLSHKRVKVNTKNSLQKSDLFKFYNKKS